MLVCARPLLVFGLLLVHPVIGASPQGSQSAPLNVFVTVVTDTQQRVADLTQSDFEIRDNGKAQPILTFDRTARPVNAVLLLDGSGTMQPVFDVARRAANDFLSQLRSVDRVAVCAFDSKMTCARTSAITSDVDAVRAGLPGLHTGFPCALYDAIGRAVEMLKDAVGRRALVVLIDGEDNVSKSSVSDVVRKANAADVSVFFIGVEHDAPGPNPSSVAMTAPITESQMRRRTKPDARALKSLWQDTGGSFVLLKNEADWGDAFASVARELHEQYVLAIEPAADGKVHRLEVKVNRAGLTARAPRTYTARRPQQTR